MKEAFPFIFLGAALYLLGRLYLLKKHGVPVQIKVIKQKIDWSPNTTASPVFEIISGDYKGETAKSMFGTTFGFHTTGSVHEGMYHPSTGMIESKTTFGVLRFFSVIITTGTIGYFIWRYAPSLMSP